MARLGFLKKSMSHRSNISKYCGFRGMNLYESHSITNAAESPGAASGASPEPLTDFDYLGVVEKPSVPAFQ